MNVSIEKTLIAQRSMLSLKDFTMSNIGSDHNNDTIFAMVVDIAQLGYTFSPTVVNSLRKLNHTDLNSFYKKTVSLLKAVVGDDVKYVPLFRKFPEQTPDRSLILEAVPTRISKYGYVMFYTIYYTWSSEDYSADWFGRQFPGVVVSDILTRPELVYDKNFKILDLATDEDIDTLFTNLISAKGSISEDNKAFVKDMVVNYNSNLEKHLPKEIPNKENLAYLISCVYERYGFSNEINQMFLPYMKTATDILRVAAALSGDDVSLSEHTKKFKLSNSQRRFVLIALDALNYNSATEDMLRFHGLWLVLSKYLHVSAYADKYPQAAKMVNAIRNDAANIETFNRKIESELSITDLTKKTNLAKFLKFVSTRPGDFARRLDHILRETTLRNAVVDQFLTVADNVATPLLLNLATHFAHRSSDAKVRVYCPKGSTTHAIVKTGEDREVFDNKLTNKLARGIGTILVSRYVEKESLGKVFIDPQLSDILIPTSMRDASSSLKVAARGSKFKIDDNAKTIRLFLYWEDKKDDTSEWGNRVDIDLSCQMMDANCNSLGVVSYYNLENMGIKHSGDITSAPYGASEFIDVNIDALAKARPDVRYIAMAVNSYTGQAFNSIVAKGGYMTRDGKSGKTFEAKTVDQKYDITAGTKFAVPLIFDLIERKVIWLDLGFHDASVSCTNIGDKGANLSILTRYALEMYREKASLYDLFQLHAKGRATSVSTKFDKAVKYDTVFDLNFATQIDEIMANYM